MEAAGIRIERVKVLGGNGHPLEETVYSAFGPESHIGYGEL
jgi:hypothetical protein